MIQFMFRITHSKCRGINELEGALVDEQKTCWETIAEASLAVRMAKSKNINTTWIFIG